MSRVEQLQSRVEPLYQQLASHPLYRTLRSMEDLRIFMESHIFAVWDFMSLLKTLQRELSCVEVPWVPSATPESRHLVNEIVLGEESDIYEGQHLSHFELYLHAMRQCGASTKAAERLILSIGKGETPETALAMCEAPSQAIAFVRDTFTIIRQGKAHAVAAAFTFGREDLIPEMFKGFVRDLNVRGQLSVFLWYLERHIEVDGGEHGPMALRMVTNLCGEDDGKWAEAEQAAVFALESRLRLWDGIASLIEARSISALP